MNIIENITEAPQWLLNSVIEFDNKLPTVSSEVLTGGVFDNGRRHKILYLKRDCYEEMERA